MGDIADEYDVEEDQQIRRESARQFTLKALTRIDEFNSYFATSFSDDDFDTVGGLVAHHFGRLPRRGEAIVIDGFEFRIVKVDHRRIDLMRVLVPRDIAAPPMGSGEA